MAKYPGRCPSNQALDLYSGCSFGCLYCIGHRRHSAQPAPATTRATLLEQLDCAGPNSDPYYLSPWTDAYQALEAHHCLTQAALERLAKRRAPCFVITRSPLVVRDAAHLAHREDAFVALSINTLDHSLTHRLEPTAPCPASRLEAAVQLREAGVRVVFKLDPILPGLTDADALETLMDAIVAVRPVAVTADTLRLTDAIATRLRQGLSQEELGQLSSFYPALTSEPIHPHLPYRQALFERIAARFEAERIRACFCRASLPQAVTPWDCRGGFSCDDLPHGA
ncbi:MAG: radical SAM protein [Myxococcota bacterium]|jgi:DNA repair photolyase|nr:radical SAM protein [Myxococcota bacterium]